MIGIYLFAACVVQKFHGTALLNETSIYEGSIPKNIGDAELKTVSPLAGSDV